MHCDDKRKSAPSGASQVGQSPLPYRHPDPQRFYLGDLAELGAPFVRLKQVGDFSLLKDMSKRVKHHAEHKLRCRCTRFPV